MNLAWVEVIFNVQRALNDAQATLDRAEDYFEQMMRIIRHSVLDKRHGIDRENAPVMAMPRGLTK